MSDNACKWPGCVKIYFFSALLLMGLWSQHTPNCHKFLVALKCYLYVCVYLKLLSVWHLHEGLKEGSFGKSGFHLNVLNLDNAHPHLWQFPLWMARTLPIALSACNLSTNIQQWKGVVGKTKHLCFLSYVHITIFNLKARVSLPIQCKITLNNLSAEYWLST